MDDQEFASRIQDKIERSTGQSIELRVDHQETGRLHVEFNREVPLVVVGANVFQFSGFARMCIEYAVASIRVQRPIDLLEFHLLLARNWCLLQRDNNRLLPRRTSAPGITKTGSSFPPLSWGGQLRRCPSCGPCGRC